MREGDFPGVRFYYTPKQARPGEDLEEAERSSCWECFGERDAAKWSAVGFFFAVQLARRLQVTVGVIGCNWGGTSASCWMSREALLAREDTRSYVEEYESSEAVQNPRHSRSGSIRIIWLIRRHGTKRRPPSMRKTP